MTYIKGVSREEIEARSLKHANMMLEMAQEKTIFIELAMKIVELEDSTLSTLRTLSEFLEKLGALESENIKGKKYIKATVASITVEDLRRVRKVNSTKNPDRTISNGLIQPTIAGARAYSAFSGDSDYSKKFIELESMRNEEALKRRRKVYVGASDFY